MTDKNDAILRTGCYASYTFSTGQRSYRVDLKNPPWSRFGFTDLHLHDATIIDARRTRRRGRYYFLFIENVMKHTRRVNERQIIDKKYKIENTIENNNENKWLL